MADQIWKDRKRHMGIPMSFTRYSLSEDRLFMSKGLLNIQDEELLLYRVRDISTRRTLWQRICGVGTLTVSSTDKTTPVLKLENIKKPMEVKEVIHRQVEEMKMRRRIRVAEVMPSSAEYDDDPADDDQ